MSMNSTRPPLASGALDRDAATRMDPQLLVAAWRDPSARLLRIRGIEVPTIEQGEVARLVWLATSGDRPQGVADPAATSPDSDAVPPSAAVDVYLGRIDGAPRFARALPHDSDEPADGGASQHSEATAESHGPSESARWRHPFEIGAVLSDADREAIGVASALSRWHEAAGFSSRDGGATTPVQGGWARIDAHGGEHFPRTDPAVIVLIEHGDRALLGSNALWETGRFSLLAGFVEAGESLEQAVRREVFEESGVRLGEIAYVTSQPWPFPRSLMLGFRAQLAPGVDPDALAPEPSEISELRWFTRDELRSPRPELKLPMPLSIARWMIDRWVAEGDRPETEEPVRRDS